MDQRSPGAAFLVICALVGTYYIFGHHDNGATVKPTPKTEGGEGLRDSLGTSTASSSEIVYIDGDPFKALGHDIISNSRSVGCYNSSDVSGAETYMMTHYSTDKFLQYYSCEIIPAHTKLHVVEIADGYMQILGSSTFASPTIWVKAGYGTWRILQIK